MKKVLSIVLTLCIVLASVPMQASAATIKLNKKKATIKVGATLKLNVKGTKKKVVWKTSNKKVATVKAGKVKAKKVGKATITAKVAGKTLKCVVKVTKKGADTTLPGATTAPDADVSQKPEKTPAPSEDNSVKDNIKVEVYDSQASTKGMALVTNNNKFPIDLELEMQFIDSKGKVVNTVKYEESIKGLEASASCYVQCHNLKDGNYGPSAASCKVVIKKAVKSTFDATQLHVAQIDVSDVNTGGIRIKVNAVNNSDKDVKAALVVLVGYDADGNIMGMNWNNVEDFKAGETKELSFYEVKDDNRNYAKSYKAFVSFAHE